MSDWCDTCGRFKFGDSHKCPPKWACVIAEDAADEDEYTYHRGTGPAEAAEAFAQSWMSDEYPSDGDTLDVVVRDGEALRYFTVVVSWSVDYSAREKRSKSEGG